MLLGTITLRMQSKPAAGETAKTPQIIAYPALLSNQSRNTKACWVLPSRGGTAPSLPVPGTAGDQRTGSVGTARHFSGALARSSAAAWSPLEAFGWPCFPSPAPGVSMSPTQVHSTTSAPLLLPWQRRSEKLVPGSKGSSGLKAFAPCKCCRCIHQIIQTCWGLLCPSLLAPLTTFPHVP